MGWTWWQRTTEDGNQVRPPLPQCWTLLIDNSQKSNFLDDPQWDCGMILNFVGIPWKQGVGCICDRPGPILSCSYCLKTTRHALWIGIVKWIQSAALSSLITDVGISGPNIVILIIKNWRWHKVFPVHSFIQSHKYTTNKLSPNWFFLFFGLPVNPWIPQSGHGVSTCSPHFWYPCPLPT